MTTISGDNYKNRILIDFLQSPEAIRSSCDKVLAYVRHGESKNFNYDYQRLNPLADFVISCILEQYPDLKIPAHGRMLHFRAAGVDRIEQLKSKVTGADTIKSIIELTIISVLLDAGAGMQWRYMDHLSNSTLSSSEGLAAASYNLFMRGIFSSNDDKPCQVDAAALRRISEELLAAALQISKSNLIIGLHGRLEALYSVADCIEANGYQRLGDILDFWLKMSKNGELSMRIIFATLLTNCNQIWPGEYEVDDCKIGDVWPHPAAVSDINPKGFVPFHKLTQWLCYSLIEPLEMAGLKITETEILTGLPEYRNGGLFIDSGVIDLKNKSNMRSEHTVNSELVIEWRALTVILLDKLAEIIRDKLTLSETQLPMSKILQGGTWFAGRKIAKQMRSDGSPPLHLLGDGRLF